VEAMGGRGNRNTPRKPAPVPLCPPQNPHNLTRARTPSAEVGSRRLAARGKALSNAHGLERLL
jgi:hypothetical protein